MKTVRKKCMNHAEKFDQHETRNSDCNGFTLGEEWRPLCETFVDYSFMITFAPTVPVLLPVRSAGGSFFCRFFRGNRKLRPRLLCKLLNYFYPIIQLKMSKPAHKVADQIALLQSRNMTFRDIATASHFLINISYYRLKGYWWEMQDDQVNHHFRNESYFEDVIDLYNFDRHFRLIVFNAVERIEIALRTKLIYHFSLAYGAEWYLNPALFDKPKEFASFTSKVYSEMGRSSEEFIVKHFENHPNEHPESWKSLEVLTLGTLSKLYQNLKHQSPEKSAIAKEFGLNNQKTLASWLLAITVVRNIVAHHGRLWNRVIINKYDWPATTPTPLLSYIPDNYQRRKIFPLLSAMLYMNDVISPGHHIKTELFELFQEFPNTRLIKMGFPSGWKDEPIWR